MYKIDPNSIHEAHNHYKLTTTHLHHIAQLLLIPFFFYATSIVGYFSFGFHAAIDFFPFGTNYRSCGRPKWWHWRRSEDTKAQRLGEWGSKCWGLPLSGSPWFGLEFDFVFFIKFSFKFVFLLHFDLGWYFVFLYLYWLESGWE